MKRTMSGLLLGWAECCHCGTRVFTWRDARDHLAKEREAGRDIDEDELSYLSWMTDWMDGHVARQGDPTRPSPDTRAELEEHWRNIYTPEQLAGKADIGC
mgnify:CR=1 FL=1